MTKIKTLTLLAVLVVLVASCAPGTPAAVPTVIPTIVAEVTSSSAENGPPQTEADVPRVSLEDAVAAIESGEAVVLDVRSAQEYQASHIPGALSIPLAQIEADPNGLNLDKDQWIITYCT